MSASTNVLLSFPALPPFSQITPQQVKPAVEQAGFAVLKAPDIPSILIESAFISNPEEEEYLNSEIGQNELCEAITKALQRYKNSLENQQKANGN